jgi:hypothetical protein
MSILFSSVLYLVLAPPAAEPPPRQLLIIAPAAFREALADYVRYKKQQLPTDLVLLEEALRRGRGGDDPERLKRFLYQRRADLGYVLLVGDADVLPVRYMVLDRITPPAFDYAFYPSDLYYADLTKPDGSFEDWNGRKDGFHGGYFGEVRGEKNKDDPINFDGIDYLPEIAVGRWPASTPEEVLRMARKSMEYEEAVRKGKHPGARRALFLSVGGWVDSRGNLDRAAARLPPGWTAFKRYYADAARNDGTPPPTKDEVVKLLDEGLGLVFHAGHGQDGEWEQCFSLNRLRKLENAGRLPVMFSAGCSTGRFATLPPYEGYLDIHGKEHAGTNHGEVFTAPPPPPAPYQRGKFNPPGLGEETLRLGPQGAVAYIGCNTGSQPCALTLLSGFTRAMEKAPAPRLGDLWVSAVRHYHEREGLARLEPTPDWYPASIYFQAMKFMLYGDPSLEFAPEGPRS